MISELFDMTCEQRRRKQMFIYKFPANTDTVAYLREINVTLLNKKNICVQKAYLILFVIILTKTGH